MVLAWGLFIPSGVFASLFWRSVEPKGRWLHIHCALQLTGVVLTIVGFAVALTMMHDGHFKGSHERCGLTIFLLAMLQPLNGFLRPHKVAGAPKGETDINTPAGAPLKRTIWEVLHKGIGYLLAVLPIAQLVTGVRLSVRLEFLYSIYGSGIVLAAIFGLAGFVLSRKKTQYEVEVKEAQMS